MTLTQSIDTCLRKYKDFKGVATRSEYWWFRVFYDLILIGFPLLAFIIEEVQRANGHGMTITGAFLILLLFVILIAGICPSWAVSVRRLHDSGLSGWHILWGFIPYLGYIIIIYLMCRSHRDSIYTQGVSSETQKGKQEYTKDYTTIKN